MLLPTFLCLGVRKCATTWLYNCLHEHPDVYVPVKELHFFIALEGDFFSTKGVPWYASYYKSARTDQARGDIATLYLREDYVPQRIQQVLPQCKMLAIFRNPIERAYSHYCMLLGQGDVTYSFDDLVLQSGHKQDYHQILQTGLYAEQLERYFTLFPQEQFLWIFLEDIKRQPARVLRNVFDFIGVDAAFEPSVTKNKTNAAAYSRSPLLYQLSYKIAHFLSCNQLDWVKRSIQNTKLYDRLWNLNRVERAKPPFPDESWTALAEYYRADIGKLSTLLNRSLDHWLVRK